MHAALVFLDLNGYDLDFPTDEAERLTVAIASRQAGKADAATFFRDLMD